MKTIKMFLLASILSLMIVSCKRRHEYCICRIPQNSDLRNFNDDWGTHNSINNFKGEAQRCEDKEKEGYVDCRFWIE